MGPGRVRQLTGETVARSPSLVAASIVVVARIEDPVDHMEDVAVMVLLEEEVLEEDPDMVVALCGGN